MTAARESAGLAQTVKLARESAYLGMYTEAEASYKEAIALARRRLGEDVSPVLRESYEGMVGELAREAAMTEKLGFVVRHARLPPSPQRGADARAPKRSLPFNRQPFSFHQEPEQRGASPSPVPSRRPPTDPGVLGCSELGGSYAQRFAPPPGKDPMVWEPAPSRPKPGASKRPRQPPRASGPAQRVAEREPRRKYDKPWQLPPPPDAPEEKRSRYLQKVYPDGTGPDADLINMIESSVISQNPSVSFDDIAGLEAAKDCLRINVLCPLTMTEYFKKIRTPPKGILLYGPPGTGKTMLAKAIAATGRTTFLYVHPTVLASKWKGDSEKLVRLLFEMARFYAPSTIFIDEVDSLLANRSSTEHESSRKVKVQFFVEIDGLCSAAADESGEVPRVFLLAATNRPWDLDDAILRRLTKRVYIPLPDAAAREQLFRLKMHGVLLADDIEYPELVTATEQYNSDDIESVCKEAAMAPFKRRFEKLRGKESVEELRDIEREILTEPVGMEDFRRALRDIRPSASTDALKDYERWTAAHSAV